MPVFAEMFKECIVAILLCLLHDVSAGFKDPFLTYPTNIESIKEHLKTERPTIAVLSLYVAGKQIKEQVPKAKGCSYIAASFVRFVETAGGRVVSLQENLKDDEVDEILRRVNGAMIPGGDIELLDDGYDRISKKIYHFAIAQKKKGIIWPVYGKWCLSKPCFMVNYGTQKGQENFAVISAVYPEI